MAKKKEKEKIAQPETQVKEETKVETKVEKKVYLCNYQECFSLQQKGFSPESITRGADGEKVYGFKVTPALLSEIKSR